MADIRSGVPALSLYTRPATAAVAPPAVALPSAPAAAPATRRPALSLQTDTYTPSSATIEPSARERLQLLSVHRGAEAVLGTVEGMLAEHYGV